MKTKIINFGSSLLTLALVSAMVIMYVLTLGDVASGIDAPHLGTSSAHSFASSYPQDSGHRAQAIEAGLNHLEGAR